MEIKDAQYFKDPKEKVNVSINATIDGIIYPSLDPSIFEVKFPNVDIEGRAVGNNIGTTTY